MDKHQRHEEERYPGLSPIPDPETENPSSTTMIEEILDEFSKEANERKKRDAQHS